MPLAFDPAAFSFAGSAPHSVLLAVVDGVVQTSLQDGATPWVVRVGSQAHAASFLHLGVVVLVLAVEQVSG